jgi:hypothetical protein
MLASHGGKRPNCDVDALLRHEPADREENTRAVGKEHHGVFAPRGRRRVEAVVDDLDLRRGEADAFHVELRERVRDRDHAVDAPRERPLDVAKRAEPERVVVVLRRDERAARSERAVDVGVHEVRMDDVRSQPPQRPPQGHQESRVEIAGHAQANGRHPELPVERLGVPVQVVEADERDRDSTVGERREQRQEMPLGAPDPAHPMDVNDLQRGAKRSQSRSAPPAASTAMRKSHGAR